MTVKEKANVVDYTFTKQKSTESRMIAKMLDKAMKEEDSNMLALLKVWQDSDDIQRTYLWHYWPAFQDFLLSYHDERTYWQPR